MAQRGLDCKPDLRRAREKLSSTFASRRVFYAAFLRVCPNSKQPTACFCCFAEVDSSCSLHDFCSQCSPKPSTCVTRCSWRPALVEDGALDALKRLTTAEASGQAEPTPSCFVNFRNLESSASICEPSVGLIIPQDHWCSPPRSTRFARGCSGTGCAAAEPPPQWPAGISLW